MRPDGHSIRQWSGVVGSFNSLRNQLHKNIEILPLVVTLLYAFITLFKDSGMVKLSVE